MKIWDSDGGENMEIRVLRYFLAVVREEGISRAADALHITQPTLSRQLSPELMATCVFAWKRQQPVAPAAARFIQYIKDALKDESNLHEPE